MLAGPRHRFECDVVRASDTGPLPLRGLRRVRLPPPGRAASPLASGSIAKKAAEEAERAQQREALKRRIKAEEAAERAQREALERKTAAEEAASVSKVRCVVPSLRGASLVTARRRLHKAHCRLGHVTAARGHHGGLVVTKQSPSRGKRLANGRPVAVWLGQPARRG